MNNYNDDVTVTETSNIFFVLEDTSINNVLNNQENIQKMLDDINDGLPCPNLFQNNENVVGSTDYVYDDYIYVYYESYNIKELIKICQYYDITKNSKIVKGKKQDLINAIVWFENSVENYAIAQQRHQMWLYIKELNNDPKMKKYLLWV